MTRVLILGCGRLGTLVAQRLIALGHHVHGVRRSATADQAFPMSTGDAAHATTWATLGTDWQAVLMSATPGLRRGRDHALDSVAAMVHQQVPSARLVYTGTTAIYGDADGAAVTETAPPTPHAELLLAIEREVLGQEDALVLRLPAIVGATRDRAVIRAREAASAGRPLLIPGDPERPFPIIHEQDAADIATAALTGLLRQERGVLNATSPQRLTARDYYVEAVRRAGVNIAIASDGTNKPSRMIDASRLWKLMPDHVWRDTWAE